MKTMKRRMAVTILLGVAALTLAGCSNSADITPGGGSQTSPPGGGGDTVSLKVAILPIGDLGAFFYAQENGIFANHGLQIAAESAAGGSAAIAAMVAGDYDVVYSGADGVIKAYANKLPLKVVSGANLNQPKGDQDANNLIAAPGITNVEQLAGAAIGTNALGNINQVYAQEFLADNGVTDVKVVEIPFPEQVAALMSGQIKATLLPEPFATQALEGGATVLGSPYRIGKDNTTLVGVYASTDQNLKDKADAISRFVDAMTQASDAANDPANHQPVVNAILKNTKLSSQVAGSMAFVHFTTDADAAQLQATADLLAKYKVLPDKVDVSGLLTK